MTLVFFSPLLSLKLSSFPGLVPGTFFPSPRLALELFFYLISSLWTLHSDSSHHSISKRSYLTVPTQIGCVCFSFSIYSVFNDSPSPLVSIYLVSVQMVSSYLLFSVAASISCLLHHTEVSLGRGLWECRRRKPLAGSFPSAVLAG